MTPRGSYTIRTVLARQGRASVATTMPFRWLRPEDGWSDDPSDPAYNQPVRHPHEFSAERLWRTDGLYDVILTLAHNDAPPSPGYGSAIFLHCWNDGHPTEGCVAIDKAALITIVAQLKPGACIKIS